MSIDSEKFDQLSYLADQIEEGDHFEMNVKSFIRLSEKMKRTLYYATDDWEIRETLENLPEIEFQAYRRSFLEQMLPKAQRGMVGKYKNREEIRGKVRETMAAFARIRRWLGEDDYV